MSARTVIITVLLASAAVLATLGGVLMPSVVRGAVPADQHTMLEPAELVRRAVNAPSVAVLPGQTSPSLGSPPAMPLVSRSVPVAASSERPANEARHGTDANYNVLWRSVGTPAWLALDLSSIPAEQRAALAVAWYCDTLGSGNREYEPNALFRGTTVLNLPRTYTIEGRAGSGDAGASAPGWVTLAPVTNNALHSRAHLVDFTGYDWIRINVAAVTDTTGDRDVQLKLEVHNAAAGTQDTWLLAGDSLTQGWATHNNTYDQPRGSYAQQIAAARPGYYPLAMSAGMVGASAGDLVQRFDPWVASFPGQYVTLNYGTNEALNNISPSTFEANMTTLVQRLLALGKTPVIPTIPWSKNPVAVRNTPALNAVIHRLYARYPEVLPGPDQWSWAEANAHLVDSADVHFNQPGGYAGLLELWVSWALAGVYSPAAALR